MKKIRCCCEILCPRRQQSSKKVCTVGDGDFMFCMHTQPMKPFQIESMSGADPEILLGGPLPSKKIWHAKTKKKTTTTTKIPRTDREEEVVSAPCTHVHVQLVSLGKGRKGRRHDVCVIVSPYIHKHIFNRIVFIRPSSDGTYYGMVMSVRPGLRLTLRPSVRLSVCPGLTYLTG